MTLLAEAQHELGLTDATPLATLSPAQLAWLRDAARDARSREDRARSATGSQI